MDLASHGNRKYLGQFFTPWPIATLMSAMTMDDHPPDKLIRICEPACGSGVMMLAFVNRALQQWGRDALQRLSVTCCDLDSYCARITAVQLVANCNLHNIQLAEILVLHGNSLLPWEKMDTVIHATSPSCQDVLPAQAPARLQALADAAQASPDAMQQLELFTA
jgi:type I restriction-modification system DNA methylase subunit